MSRIGLAMDDGPRTTRGHRRRKRRRRRRRRLVSVLAVILSVAVVGGIVVITLFGGRNDDDPYLGDTWRLGSAGWTEVTGDGPSPRARSRAWRLRATAAPPGRGLVRKDLGTARAAPRRPL